ncbi:MAG: hypothetical protein WAN66_21110 [Limnoraphis robusta]|uniref:Uncharacterized protein n=1 Tax=Limnoraphis robusta CS-951 TaxID=1637645 RepID=A0A0F5YBW7_9CYAN|nr:hypothetical protein [Limnoraphis robusta]KKD36394.1 hypothetical protein WN50_20030 [Limnoraphis robusta CS-951]
MGLLAGEAKSDRQIKRCAVKYTGNLSRSADLITQLPRSLQEQIYIAGSAGEAIAPEKLENVRAEVVAQWMVNEYPQRSYPAVAIGSSCGALVNLCAALGIPWLPQTFLIPVKHGGEIDIDEPKQAFNWGCKWANSLLENNPELKLHHMHDPSSLDALEDYLENTDP